MPIGKANHQRHQCTDTTDGPQMVYIKGVDIVHVPPIRVQVRPPARKVMMGTVLIAIIFMALRMPLPISCVPQPYCKPVPGSPDWPSQSAWQALNTSISGRLLAPIPPGLVCQQNTSFYNAAACGNVYQEWSNSSWHASDPFTSDYNDDACLPSNLAPCSAAAYPAYVINASHVSDVQAGVAFAQRTGVRLIVKGTGHDISGR